MRDRAAGEIAARAGVDVAAARTTAAALRLEWLWTITALMHDGWRDLGGGRWAPVPADERGEWTTPERGECWDMARRVEGGAGRRGADDGRDRDRVSREWAGAYSWMQSWSGPDGWIARHAARMQVLGRMARLRGTSLLNEEEDMAKTTSGRGLMLPPAARKALSARAAAVELTPERYLELLLTSGEAAMVIDNLVDRAVMARVNARRAAATAARAEPQPAGQQGGGTDQGRRPQRETA